MGNKNISDQQIPSFSKPEFDSAVNSFIVSNIAKRNEKEVISPIKIKKLSKFSKKVDNLSILNLADYVSSKGNRTEIFSNNNSIYSSLMLNMNPSGTFENESNKFMIMQSNIDDLSNLFGITQTNDINNLNKTLRSFCKYSNFSGVNEDFFEYCKEKRHSKNFGTISSKTYKSSDDIRYFSKNKLTVKKDSRNDTLTRDIKTKRSVPIEEEKENERSLFVNEFKHNDIEENFSQSKNFSGELKKKKTKNSNVNTKNIPKHSLSKEYSYKIRLINMQNSSKKKKHVNSNENFINDNLFLYGLPHEKSLLNFLKENLSPNNNSAIFNNVENNPCSYRGQHTLSKSNVIHPSYKVDIKELGKKLIYSSIKTDMTKPTKYFTFAKKNNDINLNDNRKLHSSPNNQNKKKHHKHFISKLDYLLDFDQSYKKKLKTKETYKNNNIILKGKKKSDIDYEDSVNYYKYLLSKEKENLATKDDTITEGNNNLSFSKDESYNSFINSISNKSFEGSSNDL